MSETPKYPYRFIPDSFPVNKEHHISHDPSLPPLKNTEETYQFKSDKEVASEKSRTPEDDKFYEMKNKRELNSRFEELLTEICMLGEFSDPSDLQYRVTEINKNKEYRHIVIKQVEVTDRKYNYTYTDPKFHKTKLNDRSENTLTSEEWVGLAPDPDKAPYGPETWTDLVYVKNKKLNYKRGIKISNYGRIRSRNNPDPHYVGSKINKMPTFNVEGNNFSVPKLVYLAFGLPVDPEIPFNVRFRDKDDRYNLHITNIEATVKPTTKPIEVRGDMDQARMDRMLENERWVYGPFTISNAEDELDGTVITFPSTWAVSTAGRLKLSEHTAPMWSNTFDQTGHPVVSMGGKNVRVSRIVGVAFVEKPNTMCTRVGLVDREERRDCSVKNVRWMMPRGAGAVAKIQEAIDISNREDIYTVEDLERYKTMLKKIQADKDVRDRVRTRTDELLNMCDRSIIKLLHREQEAGNIRDYNMDKLGEAIRDQHVMSNPPLLESTGTPVLNDEDELSLEDQDILDELFKDAPEINIE